jgi:tungstate transport system substrate-binding protein
MRKTLLVLTLVSGATLLVARSCATEKPDGAGPGGAALRLATTTSVVDSGLLEAVRPELERRLGLRIEVEAVGSGQALARLAEGAADVALTHSPSAERALVSSGKAVRRTPVMRSDFVLVGPGDAAAVVAGSGSIGEALRRVAGSGRRLVSRGDDSGTHRRELELLERAGISPGSRFIVRADAGMAATLRRAADEKAFTLTDRATFIALRGKLDLAILFQGGEALENTYSIVEPRAGAGRVHAAGARALADLLRAPEARALVGRFGVERFGEPLFTPVDASTP